LRGGLGCCTSLRGLSLLVVTLIIMTAKSIKLVALDLDGTTLNNSHEFSERTKATLLRLSAKGVVVTLASGRSTLDINKHIDKLGLLQRASPGVSYNGAYGFVREHADDGSVQLRKVFERPVSSDLASDLISFASELGHVLHVSAAFQRIAE
jgi:hydroxymethylpyrimidine pyrophosphatase-like HAD family hydrolase